LLKHLHPKVVARLTEHVDIIKPLLGGAPRLALALSPAPALNAFAIP